LRLKAGVEVGYRLVDAIKAGSFNQLGIVTCSEQQPQRCIVVAGHRLNSVRNIRRSLSLSTFAALLAATHVFNLIACIFKVFREVLC
jgi:hypothetical protein